MPTPLESLDKTNWQTFRFDEIARNISERVEPGATDLTVYVGLEHIDSGSLHIKRTGKPTDVEGTKLRVYAGDVIFGRRRAYQRKAAVATFDGICSAHALVLRAKPDIIDPRLFPFFLHSDAFMHRAVDISVGGLSPTINWGNLKLEKFLLPPRDQQARLAELMWAADAVGEGYEKVRQQLHHTRQSFHQHYFDTFDTITIGEIASKVGSGKTPTGGEKVYTKEGVVFFRSQNVLTGKIDFQDIAFIPEGTHKSMKSSRVIKNDVLLNITGASIGRSAVFEGQVDEANVNQHVCIIRSEHYDPYAICEYLNSSYGQEQINRLQTGGNRQGLNFQNLKELEMPNFGNAEMRSVSRDIHKIRSQDEQLEKAVDTSRLLKQQLINQIFST